MNVATMNCHMGLFLAFMFKFWGEDAAVPLMKILGDMPQLLAANTKTVGTIRLRERR